MSRYIGADALIERWNNMSVRGRTEFDQEIMVAPSIDIVFCKECKHRYRSGYRGDEYWVCDFMDAKIKDDDFCSYGAKEGE